MKHPILKYPLSTEKAVRLMEMDNVLTFIVDIKAKKPEIKQAVEKQFNVKVLKINTLIQRGVKKAYLTLSPDTPARDVATSLGLT